MQSDFTGMLRDIKGRFKDPEAPCEAVQALEETLASLQQIKKGLEETKEYRAAQAEKELSDKGNRVLLLKKQVEESKAAAENLTRCAIVFSHHYPTGGEIGARGHRPYDIQGALTHHARRKSLLLCTVIANCKLTVWQRVRHSTAAAIVCIHHKQPHAILVHDRLVHIRGNHLGQIRLPRPVGCDEAEGGVPQRAGATRKANRQQQAQPWSHGPHFVCVSYMHPHLYGAPPQYTFGCNAWLFRAFDENRLAL